MPKKVCGFGFDCGSMLLQPGLEPDAWMMMHPALEPDYSFLPGDLWAEVTPRQIAGFKAHSLRKDIESGQWVLSDATVRRILGTLKNFYGWMV